MRKWFHFLLLLTCISLFPRLALAQRVLLVRPPASDATLFEAFGRLRAELELGAFDVVVLDDGEGARDVDALERASQAQDAFAAIALRRASNGTTARILIVDRVTGKSVTRKLLIDTSPNGPTLLAVRAADLLRASLVEFGPGERPPEEVVGVEAKPTAPEVLNFAKSAPKFSVRAGALALFTPELGFGAGPLLAAELRPVPELSVGVKLSGPVHGAELKTSNGVATLRQELALATIGWSFSDASQTGWHWGPILGVGAYHLHATSIVSLPFVAEADGSWSAIGNLGFQVQRWFQRTVSVGIDMGALGLLPRPVVAVADQRSAPIALQGYGALEVGVVF